MQTYNYEKLEVYQLASKFAVKMYRFTDDFPKSEIFGLTSQIRRAAVSVVLNIVEGNSRSSKKDFALFIERSAGSAVEIRAALTIAAELGYLKKGALVEVHPLLDEIYFKLQAFKKYLRS